MQINIYSRKKLLKIITTKNDLLEYFNQTKEYSNFKKINDSLIDYIKNIKNISKTDFFHYIQKYQTSGSQRQVLYWTRRGYSKEEAKKQVSNIQKNNSKKRTYKKENNPRCKEYYINKGYNPEQAKEQVSNFQKKCSPRTLIYWINKGYNPEQAENQLKKYQNNSKYIDYKNRLLPSNIDYWLNKGYTLEQAEKQVYNNQNTASKEKMIEKYGPIQGLIKLNQIKHKKRDTFHSRPIEEQIEINKKRGNNSIGYWSNGRFNIYPEMKNKPGVLYYFKYTINNKNHWKIGITQNFENRFSKTIHKRYNIEDVELTYDTLYNCFITEQMLLKIYNKYRESTILTTESFNKNIKDKHENW